MQYCVDWQTANDPFSEPYILCVQFQTVQDPGDKGSNVPRNVVVYLSVRRHISADSNLNQHHSENLKILMIVTVLTPVYKEHRLVGCDALLSSQTFINVAGETKCRLCKFKWKQQVNSYQTQRRTVTRLRLTDTSLSLHRLRCGIYGEENWHWDKFFHAYLSFPRQCHPINAPYKSNYLSFMLYNLSS